MENKAEAEQAIFNQVCQVNDLDPQAIRQEATRLPAAKGEEGEAVDALIRTAFRHRANELVADLKLGNSLADGKEYQADGDPAAPSFTINEDYIRETYGKEVAEKIIAALGQVQLPIRA